MTLTSKAIRQTFFDFFRSKDHAIVKSSPIVVKDDPTLMFTNAGMNQFKDIFLGDKAPRNLRVANSQKCLRVSGKHNDLEEVGVDTYHHTMFEMLGNWSFGDYFKQEAIAWSWELLTEKFKIDKDRLYVTIFQGEASDNLSEDTESKAHWQEFVDDSRILSFDRKDNFWEMGEAGPCGPCSEIHIDLRNKEERAKQDARELVNKDHPRVIEIWNLVFIQYNRKASGKLMELPKKHVDTGMGLERLAMVLQGKQSNYDTDIFQTLIDNIGQLTGVNYGSGESKKDVAIRVVSDHVRAVAFCIADGQLPANTGAGYVVRRILRRAIRYGYSFLNKKDPFIFQLVPVLVSLMGEAFEELKSQEGLISKVIKEEEEGFLKTLERGILRLEEVIANTSDKVIKGEVIFELYDTYGFPVDLTNLILREHNKAGDMKGFERELQKQKDRSKKAGEQKVGDWTILKEHGGTEFIGYDQLESEVQITRYREVKQKGKAFYQLVFDNTPFYSEGGGQVGDSGKIYNDDESIEVFDTKRENQLIVHFVRTLPARPEQPFKAHVNVGDRKSTARNHSATHLLHYALRTILGTHVEQKGSLVHPDYLRFDFSHFQKVTEEELDQIEGLVNELIRENISLNEHRSVPFDKAKEMGALALFGEKYGDEVRVVQFDDSIELCGGTHVGATGEIGYFKVVGETAVASGIRRIEAVTGSKAQGVIRDQDKLVKNLKKVLKSNDLEKGISDLLAKNKGLTASLEQLNSQVAKAEKDNILNDVEQLNGISLIRKKTNLDSKAFKDLTFQLRDKLQSGVVLLANESNGKVALNLSISKDLVESKNLHAGNIVKELAQEVNGGGGGQPFFASAGGSDPSGIERVLDKISGYLK